MKSHVLKGFVYFTFVKEPQKNAQNAHSPIIITVFSRASIKANYPHLLIAAKR